MALHSRHLCASTQTLCTHTAHQPPCFNTPHTPTHCRHPVCHPPTPRGYIVDVSLKGTSVEPDVDDMESAYGAGTTPADVLQGRVKAPVQAQLLYNALKTLEGRGVAGATGAAAI